MRMREREEKGKKRKGKRGTLKTSFSKKNREMLVGGMKKEKLKENPQCHQKPSYCHCCEKKKLREDEDTKILRYKES